MPLNSPSPVHTPPGRYGRSGQHSGRGQHGRRSSRTQHFGQFPLQYRVLLSQLPLTISALLVAVAVVLFEPDVATASPLFAAGLGGILLLTLAAAVVPWQRFPPIAYWAIPLLDFVAIAPFWSASRYVLDGMSMLSAFPVFWLAWSGMYPALAISLGFVGTAAATWWPYLYGTPGLEPQLIDASLVRPALVPFLTLALGLAASVLTRSMDRQSLELKASLDTAATQNRLLHTVVENSNVGILVLDRDGNEILMNQVQRRLHFLALRTGHLHHRETEMLVFEADGCTPVPAEERPAARALRGESFDGRIVAIGADGSQQLLSASAAPMFDDAGSFDGTVVIFQNVTDLLGAIRAREQFVAEISHEFRTPLTSIIGYLDLALDSDPDPVLEQYLTTSIRNAERLLTLVTNLLDARASTSTISVQEVDLVRLIRQSVESIAPRAHRSGIHLQAELPIHLEAKADTVKLAQVVDNLLSNAVKYTPQGGSITVSLRRNTPAGTDEEIASAEDWAELTIRDTGIGMTEQERGNLFTNFYRTEHVRKAAIPGTGLGLAISRGFVRAHGGDIVVSSKPGAGSTFTVHIPVAGPPEG